MSSKKIKSKLIFKRQFSRARTQIGLTVRRTGNELKEVSKYRFRQTETALVCVESVNWKCA